MSNVAIKVENLGKKYLIGHQKSGDLRSSISNKLKDLMGKSNSIKEEFWALRDIDFEIKQGEAVGIIGRNGAGKSTLLKILSRITAPTTGRFEINGRVSSLLEVGTGFHMELTGRENIYLNGTILGMKRSEIKAKFDQIVDFSGIEKFLDTPVKHYSSGMKVRLAFSVAAHLEPEILIVDEVLAVGDAEFQKKCLGKMDEVRKAEGRTILFVSHNLAAISVLCNKGIMLQSGKMIGQHKSLGEIIKLYGDQVAYYSRIDFSEKIVRFHTLDFLITDLKLTTNDGLIQETFVCGSSMIFRMDYKKNIEGSLHDVAIGLIISTLENQFITVLNNKISGNNLIIHEREGHIEVVIDKLPFMSGEFVVTLVVQYNGKILQRVEEAAILNVIEGDYFESGFPNSLNRHGVYVTHKWLIQ